MANRWRGPDDPMTKAVAGSLKAVGFKWAMTGGGCTAYIRTFKGVDWYITKPGEPVAPDSLTEPVEYGPNTPDFSPEPARFKSLAELTMALAGTCEYCGESATPDNLVEAYCSSPPVDGYEAELVTMHKGCAGLVASSMTI